MNQREDERRRRERQQREEAGWSAGDIAAGAIASLALGAASYKLYQYFSGSSPEPSSAQRAITGGHTMASSQGWSLTSLNPLKLFWKNVEIIEEEEVSAGQQLHAQVQLESKDLAKKYKHKYNKFDLWFENLNANTLQINKAETKKFKFVLNEVLETLLPEMQAVDPLFKLVYRKLAPAGSSWENLRICAADEYDINVILFPKNIQSDYVEVVDLGKGHIGIRLARGFMVPKVNNSDPWSASITSQLRNWVEDGFVNRSRVIFWMQSVVDTALQRLESKKNFNYVKKISRSMSGPAITLNIKTVNYETFSIDLVPSVEFATDSLPRKMFLKVREKSTIARTWYAIPKGPKGISPTNFWRVSLYELERDVTKGHYHLKPSIRILKRLRDEQSWNPLASYYLKTCIMWLKDEKDIASWGLGQSVMEALLFLLKSLREGSIRYYWDDSLNLIDFVDPRFLVNVGNHLQRIIQMFERSLTDDSVDPMCIFGCDKHGNNIR